MSADGDHEEEGHGNHEAWVIPYADMVTLLMALFLMLYAIGQMDLRKFEQLSAGLGEALGGNTPTIVDPVSGGTSGMLDGGTAVVAPLTSAPAPEPEAAAAARGNAAAADAAAVALIEVEARVLAAAEQSGFADAVDVRRDERGLVVAFGADRLLFAPGSDQLQDLGGPSLEAFAQAVAPLPNAVTVEGHTDSAPIATSRFPSNWELSTARATRVLRYLADGGLPMARLSAVGYADQRPRAEGDTTAARQANRRVELVVHAPTTVDPPDPVVVGPDLDPLTE